MYIYLFDILVLNFGALEISASHLDGKIENSGAELWDPLTPLREQKWKNPEIGFWQIYPRCFPLNFETLSPFPAKIHQNT